MTTMTAALDVYGVDWEAAEELPEVVSNDVDSTAGKKRSTVGHIFLRLLRSDL